MCIYFYYTFILTACANLERTGQLVQILFMSTTIRCWTDTSDVPSGKRRSSTSKRSDSGTRILLLRVFFQVKSAIDVCKSNWCLQRGTLVIEGNDCWFPSHHCNFWQTFGKTSTICCFWRSHSRWASPCNFRKTFIRFSLFFYPRSCLLQYNQKGEGQGKKCHVETMRYSEANEA